MIINVHYFNDNASASISSTNKNVIIVVHSRYYVRFSCKCQLKWKSMANSTTLSDQRRGDWFEWLWPRKQLNSICPDHLLCRSLVHFSAYFPFVSMCGYYRALLDRAHFKSPTLRYMLLNTHVMRLSFRTYIV